MSTRADERGLAAPVVVTLAGLLVVMAMTLAVLGRLLVDHRRVTAAADLAALAGAAAVQHLRPGCEAARVVAERNGAALHRCSVQGQRVRVEVRLRAAPLVGREVRLGATAHAGPVRP